MLQTERWQSAVFVHEFLAFFQIAGRVDREAEQTEAKKITEDDSRQLLGLFWEYIKDRNIPEVRKLIATSSKES